ncbi:hypothetical protein BDZ45DRAFT_812157 [Acephala macrosclerotiorum]|nr:hypothetical protein BDZ45DRAFT_812157 [Acephala macrosclerotiorum]
MEAPSSDSKVDTQRMLTEILQHCQNINQMLDANGFDRINQTLDRIDQRFDSIDHSLDKMEQSMQKTENRFVALEANQLARSINRDIISKHPHSQLHPLVNTHTGEKIPNFPATAGAIAIMPTTYINRIFEEIGFKVPVGATPKRKRELLRQVIGLPLRDSSRSSEKPISLVLRPRI